MRKVGEGWTHEESGGKERERESARCFDRAVRASSGGTSSVRDERLVETDKEGGKERKRKRERERDVGRDERARERNLIGGVSYHGNASFSPI